MLRPGGSRHRSESRSCWGPRVPPWRCPGPPLPWHARRTRGCHRHKCHGIRTWLSGLFEATGSEQSWTIGSLQVRNLLHLEQVKAVVSNLCDVVLLFAVFPNLSQRRRSRASFIWIWCASFSTSYTTLNRATRPRCMSPISPSDIISWQVHICKQCAAPAAPPLSTTCHLIHFGNDILFTFMSPTSRPFHIVASIATFRAWDRAKARQLLNLRQCRLGTRQVTTFQHVPVCFRCFRALLCTPHSKSRGSFPTVLATLCPWFSELFTNPWPRPWPSELPRRWSRAAAM